MSATTLNPRDSQMRAALTLVALGSERAANVLRALPEEVAMKLVREIEHLGPVDAATAQQLLATVADELKHKTVVGQGGPAYSLELSRRAFGAERAEAMGLARAAESRFVYLSRAAAADVARVLSSEPLSVVALVLAHLEPAVAAGVMALLPTPVMAEVSMRIAQLRPVHETVITLVEEDLRVRLAPLLGQRIARFDGLQLLAQFMNNSTKELEQELLGSMRDRDPTLADQLREMLFVFEDIARLSDRGVQELLKAVDTRVLSVAMKSAPEIVTDKFFKNMSERARENLREEIEFLRGVKPTDIRDAQKSIVATVRQLEAAGSIVIERAGGDDGGL
ncbi:MAG: FliG C-terminal domain-containing protein [Acidimicrobiales bacterium]